MSASPLAQDYPWVSSPVIISAPMSGFAGPALAHEVYKAGGIGFLGAVPNIDAYRTAIGDVCELVTGSRSVKPGNTLPIGLGALVFAQKLDQVRALVEESQPIAVWLFAAHSSDDYKLWTDAIRAVSSKTKIWIQVGSVAGALQIAQSCKPDVLVLQGADAGGHGGEKGAGIISLVPEARDALTKAGADGISVVAAGGIADGRGVAAALALGADGVVMGTKFLIAEEAGVHPAYQAAVLETEDGGQTTVRAKVFDELAGPNIWPEDYDGRALITDSYRDHVKGISIEEIRRLHADSKQNPHAGFGGENKRAAIWAGTGIGLAREKASAARIVNEVRDEADRTISKLTSWFS